MRDEMLCPASEEAGKALQCDQVFEFKNVRARNHKLQWAN